MGLFAIVVIIGALIATKILDRRDSKFNDSYDNDKHYDYLRN